MRTISATQPLVDPAELNDWKTPFKRIVANAKAGAKGKTVCRDFIFKSFAWPKAVHKNDRPPCSGGLTKHGGGVISGK